MRSGRAGPPLFRSAGKGSKRGRSDRRDGRLCTAHRQQEALMHVRSRSANLPKLAALLQKAHAHSGFKHMERFPHSSHAVRCYKCCLGLPLAFCAAFRCSLRWRFTTRLFVHVFLPFGFFDKLQKHAQCIRVGRCFFCCETVKPFHSVFFFPGSCTPEHTALELNGHPVGANSRFQQQFRRFPI